MGVSEAADICTLNILLDTFLRLVNIHVIALILAQSLYSIAILYYVV